MLSVGWRPQRSPQPARPQPPALNHTAAIGSGVDQAVLPCPPRPRPSHLQGPATPQAGRVPTGGCGGWQKISTRVADHGGQIAHVTVTLWMAANPIRPAGLPARDVLGVAGAWSVSPMIPFFITFRSNCGGVRPAARGFLTTSVLCLWASLGAQGATLDPAALVPTDIGSPAVGGSTTNRGGAVTLSAAGSGIGFATDQFHFACATVDGDFDVRVRVADLEETDLWAKAGLMIRQSVDPGSAFAAVFTTPSGAGCVFQSRDTPGAAAANQGTFPANQPFTWLRLRREGDQVSGYAGYDGRRWTLLGTRTLTLETPAWLGLAATSHNQAVTRAEFRDLGEAEDGVLEEVAVDLEPPGPSSRRTALTITEIMYHPAPRADGKNLEFIEVYNSQPYFEEIGGWRLTGEVEYRFPAGTVIPGGGHLVVAASPPDLASAYELKDVLGPYVGNLNDGGGRLRLLGDRNAVLLEVEYNDRWPWPELADGMGHSLVLARPSYGEGDVRAWRASRVKGGSPGRPEAVELASGSGVRINEWLMPDESGSGFIELFNSGTQEADLAGLRLGRSPASMLFTVPAGLRLAPGGFAQFTWTELGFRPDPVGDTLLLESADGSRFLDLVRCRPHIPATSSGRWPNGSSMVRLLTQPTPGTANARPRVTAERIESAEPAARLNTVSCRSQSA